MITATRRSLHLLALAWVLLCSLAWAGPRIAIVTPLSSEVWLDDVHLASPRLVEEGQKLLLGEKGSVRIQLLGSGKEVVLQGSRLLSLSRASLDKEAQTVARGSVDVGEEHGSLSRVAAVTGRLTDYSHHRPVGFAVQLPPEPTTSGHWTMKVLTPAESFPGNIRLDLVDAVTQRELAALTITAWDSTLILEPEMLAPGGRYCLRVSTQQGNDRLGYQRHFQVFTTEEHNQLEDTAEALRAEIDAEAPLPGLFALARFYDSLDDAENLAPVLDEILARPELSEDDRATARALRNGVLASLDRDTSPPAP